MNRRFAGYVFAVLGLLAPHVARAQADRYQVFFVAIGSGWYAPAPSKRIHGFSEIDGANRSAAIVTDGLTSGGAVYGVKLTADDGIYVTTADIETALAKVKAKISSEKPAKPLLFFYIASHGMSEGIAWSHFSIPGDFGYRGDPDKLDIDSLSKNTLYAGDLVDSIEKLHIPFVVLLDSCYDGKEKHFEPTVLSAEATRNLNDVGAALRVMNEFRDTYPILFSTTPGQSVATVQNPLAPDSKVNIGPLARRFNLSTTRRLADGHALSLATLVSDMTSSQLDSLTTPAVTHSKIPSGADAPLLLATTAKSSVDSMVGSGTRMNVCCVSGSAATQDVGHTSRHIAGTLSLTGDAGEFVSSGRSRTFKSPAQEVQLTQNGPGDIQISFGREDKEFDTSFSTDTGKRFEVRSYAGAERWGFGSSGHPGLEISGDGHGCNEIAGSFNVTEVAYSPDGKITRFAATFVQQCDDSKLAARGTVDIRAQ